MFYRPLGQLVTFEIMCYLGIGRHGDKRYGTMLDYFAMQLFSPLQMSPERRKIFVRSQICIVHLDYLQAVQDVLVGEGADSSDCLP
jgi:hypothetical protein